MIAKKILEQIGGRRFAAMTGSKDFIDMGNGLRMRPLALQVYAAPILT